MLSCTAERVLRNSRTSRKIAIFVCADANLTARPQQYCTAVKQAEGLCC